MSELRKEIDDYVENIAKRDHKARMFVAYHDAFLIHRSQCEACKIPNIKLEDCTIGHLAFVNMDNALQELRKAYKVQVHGA